MNKFAIKGLLAAATLLGSIFTVSTIQANTVKGDDGLHKADWLTISFRDVTEDVAEATEQGKRHIILYEQKGCVYCDKMHETVLQDEEVIAYLKEHYVVVQYNLYGDEEVTDTDGEVLSEKAAAKKWGINFTPTWFFLPEELDGETHVGDAASGNMYGAFGKGTFLDMLTWVYNKGYDTEEGFQRYHARRIREAQEAAGDDAASVPTD